MNRIPRLVPAAWVACALVACSSGGGGGSSATQEIGPAGGTLSVTSGPLSGLTLTVPANALAASVAITVTSVGAPNLPGFVPVGPAARFEPAGTTFTPPASLVTRFDALRIPAGRTTSDLLLKRQDPAGAVTDLTITNVDTNSSTVTAEVPGFSTIWPVVPDPAAIEWPYETLWPLTSGSLWEYDDESTIHLVSGLLTVPGLPVVDRVEISFYIEGERFGVWFEQLTDGSIVRVGDFDDVAGAAFARVIDPPQPFAPATVSNGAVVSSGPDPYQIYELLGSAPIASGTVTYTGTFTWVGRMTVPAGTFENVYQWVIDETAVEDGVPDSSQITFWLAPDVGPIQYRIDGLTQRLTSFRPGSRT